MAFVVVVRSSAVAGRCVPATRRSTCARLRRTEVAGMGKPLAENPCSF